MTDLPTILATLDYPYDAIKTLGAGLTLAEHGTPVPASGLDRAQRHDHFRRG